MKVLYLDKMILTAGFAVLLMVLQTQGQTYSTATVEIVPGSSPSVYGKLTITATDSGVVLRGIIYGLTPNLHGFHIHQNGGLGNECKDAGGHFNPFEKTHGHPGDAIRHVGDLGNINANQNGEAVIEIFDPLASLVPTSPAYIGNRAVVVHAKTDDLGRGNNAESLKTGNAGSRVGCGIIKVQAPHLTQQHTNNQGNSQVYKSSGSSNYAGPNTNNNRNQPTDYVPSQSRLSLFGASMAGGASNGYQPSSPFQNQQRYSPSFGESRGSIQVQKSASVKIIPGTSKSVGGELEIEEVKGGVIIKGFINGLKPGHHGFHVHEIGDLGNECRNAKGHFNPFELKHGDPKDHHRHVGDLGNVEANTYGTAHINIFDPKASLDPHSKGYIGGRAMVVHADTDDLGKGGDRESLITGNAGARVGCGIIEVQASASGFHSQRQHFITFQNNPVPVYRPQRPQSPFGSFYY